MMNSKTMAVMLSAMLALCVSACGDKAPAASTANAATPEAQTASAQRTEPAKPAAPKLPEVVTTDLGNNVYMLQGRGGNVGVSVGDDGVIVIDDQFAEMAPALMAAIAKISDAPIKFMVNTHYHGDHTGGNAEFRKIGAAVVAHHNVHKRQSSKIENQLFGRTVEPVADNMKPHLTYSESATFHMNGGHVQVIYAPGHTDGDSLIYFEDANVIHMGDNFFNGLFPYVDIDAGGSVKGMIAAHQTALDLANAQTQIIPGHGPMATATDLKAAQDLLKDVLSRVKSRIDDGQNLEAILADNPLKGYEKFESFIDMDKMVRIAFRELTGG